MLTASDLNAEFNNILNNPGSLICPIGFNVTFTDATYDIGASGATRPRDLFLSRDLTYGRNFATAQGTDICDGRLTLTSGTAVTTGDVLAAETLYWTPYKGNRVALYDGSTLWNVLTFTELSIDVPDATGVYDVFVYNNSGTAALELTAWTNDTTRATALTTQNGVLVKTGATTRRYLGTFYSTIAGNGQIEDSVANRFLWNYYNRVRRRMVITESTDTWPYTLATWRQANANAVNQLNFVIGVAEELVTASVYGVASNSGGNTIAAVGIGVDVTNANNANVVTPYTAGPANVWTCLHAAFIAVVAVGKHYLAWVEYSQASGTTTWMGDNGLATNVAQSGIYGEIIG